MALCPKSTLELGAKLPLENGPRGSGRCDEHDFDSGFGIDRDGAKLMADLIDFDQKAIAPHRL